jgi:YidC/Oxa1 family membrane protein insertase
MDQKRFFMWIAVSIVILLGFQYFGKRFETAPPPANAVTASAAVANAPAPGAPATAPKPSDTIGVTSTDAGATPIAPPAAAAAATPRLPIDAQSVKGSISLVGARFDDLVLRDYRETIDKNAPLVRLFEPTGQPQPYYAQFGWSAAPGTTVKLPTDTTLWTASAASLTSTTPVTLSWDNGAGLIYQLVVSIDAHYMFSVQQRVLNHSAGPVSLIPWSRVRRDYTPPPGGTYLSFEGMTGVMDGTLREVKYPAARKDAATANGIAKAVSGPGGWAGFTDKYWLAALAPDYTTTNTVSFRSDQLANGDGYQVDFAADTPQSIPAGGTAAQTTRLFAGAKVVDLLQRYQSEFHIESFWKAVDFGLFWFLTRPIFFCIDWLFRLTGNFGIAIMIFTVFVKVLFFPLANKSYRSMGKMRDLGPKMKEMRERYKDEPAKLQTEMMGIYKKEGVNPAGGCLPMIVQIPVFFSLYKVIYVTIEMRQAPFFGWIRDLSATDPTNIFTLFGLIPYNPMSISPLLHLGVWPLFMGFTMFIQQRLNPPPPDPMQAKLFQFMPVVFTFMMGRFPAGLVIYWSWNNLLTAAQQWFIMRSTRKPAARIKAAT